MKNLNNLKTAKIQNEALKMAIKELKKDNIQSKQITMFEELQKAHLLIPAIFNIDFATEKDGKVQLPSGAQIKFVLVNADDGKVFFPAFTDMEEAQKFSLNQKGNIQYIVRTIKDFQPMLEDSSNAAEGLVINPSSTSIVISTSLIQKLNSVSNKKEIDATSPVATPIRFSEPTLYPTALVNVVHDVCVQKENIIRVWLKSMTVGQVVSLALIIEMNTHQAELLDEIKQLALPLAKGVPVVTLALDENLKKNVVHDSFPLYDKELGL